MELSEIKFTKDEFDMIIKGIEALPNQDQAAELMTGLLETALMDKIDKSPQGMDFKIQREREKARKEQQKKMEKDILKENCIILQSKLIQLRRYMEQNNMIVQAQEIIDGTHK